jgi:hypothetical protein
MALYGMKGDDADRRLIEYAVANAPSLILDCANKADLHRLYTSVDHEKLRQTYVIAVDAIYRFRDTVRDTGKYAERVGAKTVVITSYDHLYAFHDDKEEEEVIGHTWELIVRLSKEYDVALPWRDGCTELKMGHTVSSGRIATYELLSELSLFAKSLSPQDRKVFDEMLKEPYKHISKISYTSSAHLWAIVLLTIMMEMEKRRRYSGDCTQSFMNP